MTFNIENINVLPWTEEYKIELSPQYGNDAFTCTNGDTIDDYKGDKVIVSFTLRRVSTELAKRISSALNSREITCTVSAPMDIDVKFTKTAYRAEPYEKGSRWHFDVTLESSGLINSGDSL